MYIYKQSAPNTVKIYMTIRPWMSSIMGLQERQRPELSVRELRQILYLILFTF